MRTALDFKSAQFDPVYNKDETEIEIQTKLTSSGHDCIITSQILKYGTVSCLHAITDL